MASPAKDSVQDRGLMQDALKMAQGAQTGGVPPQALTFQELFHVVKSEDWKAGYKPWSEMAKNFKSAGTVTDNWGINAKANLHYFRTNYAIILAGAIVLTVIQRPLVLVSLAILGLSLAIELQDSFAIAVSHKLTAVADAYAPAVASKIHDGTRRTATLRAQSPAAVVCGLPRSTVCQALKGVAAIAMLFSGAWVALASSAALGAGAVVAHASFKVANPKARTAQVKEELRSKVHQRISNMHGPIADFLRSNLK